MRGAGFPQPHHLLCFPKMPRMKPTSTHSRNLIIEFLLFLLNAIRIIVVATSATRALFPHFTRSAGEPMVFVVSAGLIEFATTFPTFVLKPAHFRIPPRYAVATQTTVPQPVRNSREPSVMVLPVSTAPNVPSTNRKLSTQMILQIVFMGYRGAHYWASATSSFLDFSALGSNTGPLMRNVLLAQAWGSLDPSSMMTT